jgi:hypothetical protein
MPNVVPPPSVLQGAGARAPIPPVVAPARAVAITNAKTVAAQAIAPPKRRRSFTGEARASAEKARTPEPSRPPHRARRRTFEDESTLRQPLNVPLAPVAAVPMGDAQRVSPPALAGVERPDPSSMFDDLDEDTRVLQTRRGGGTDDLIDQAFERLRTGNRAEAALASNPVASHLEESDTLAGTPVAAFLAAAASASHAPAAASQTTAVQQAPIHDEFTTDGSEGDRAPPSGETKIWSQLPDMDGPPATERPPSIPDLGPQVAVPASAPRPAKRVASLPALRVAVLATSVPGEVRLIALDPGDDAPPGAALAVLVPLSPADGESVTRLFGSLE